MVAACELMGISRATHYRRLSPPAPVSQPVPQAERVQPAALTQAERDQIVAILVDEANADLSVRQLYYRTLDSGVHLGSARTWYRIAAARRLSGDRRRQARHPARVIPILRTDGPNQVWSWDITMLPGPTKGCNYRLYQILDVYSRYVIAWRLEHHEQADLAVEMLTSALEREQAQLQVLHADNGPAMISDAMKEALASRGITKSHSRPHVSNDNPFSEAQFKTMKYQLNYPGHFTDIDTARHWVTTYVSEYNNNHRHSGIGHYTPASVHDNTWHQTHARRQALLDADYQAHPHRYRKPPQAPTPNNETWINKPQPQPDQQAA